jgi:hypothetical protein
MRPPLPLALLLLCGCPKDPEDSPPKDDTGKLPDTDTDDTGVPPAQGFTATTEVLDGSSGTIVLEFSPVGADATTHSFTVDAGETFNTDTLSDGAYGLRAWLDEDGDGAWDGIWTGQGEPSALMGVTVPEEGLHIALRRGVPAPFLDDDPELVELYDAAWGFALEHVAAGTTGNGFADHYMDEAFCDLIFQWDSCFMALFGVNGLDAFPVMPTLDNFYGVQRDDGYICRIVDETTGEAMGDASDPSEPMINPPLFAWAELRYAQRSGDLSRLPRVLPVLEAYTDWLDGNVRTGPGLYYTSMLGSGMDNAPRDAAYDGWVDQTAQVAMARRDMGDLHSLLGESGEAAAQYAEAEAICSDLRALMWDDDEGWFFDLDNTSGFLTEKTLASVWPLVAGCATPEQQARVVAHLQDPAEFWRVHVFPSTAADAPSYDPHGYYWRGGVWAPTTYASIQALVGAGRRDLARAATDNHLRNLLQVYTDFVPDLDELAEEARGDGTRTLWELYAPDHVEPGTRWDAGLLGRQDFVGWTGLGPIALLLEQSIGLEPDAPADTLTLHLHRTDRHGVDGYRFGDQLVDLEVAQRSSADAPATITISTTDAMTLLVESAGQWFDFALERGEHSLEVDPAGGILAAATVPGGPFPGYAVLGNGRVAAVYSDDDGSGDPPGVFHLYRGDFATDLLELGQTLVGQGGARITERTVGLDPFFVAYTQVPLPDGGAVAWRSFVGQEEAVVIQGALLAPDASTSSATIAPLVQLREQVHMDGTLTWQEVGRDEASGLLWAELSDGTGLAVAASPTPAGWQTGTISADPVAGGLTDTVQQGRQLVLAVDLEAAAGWQAPFRWIIALGDDPNDAIDKAERLIADADPLADAEAYWADWAPEALCEGARCDSAAANLYAARASSLAGAVPADLTGQFVTDDRPQLYPRDALMVARVLEHVGHSDEAWEIVHFWLDPALEQIEDGWWYARYDALGRAVDGGSGALYDVPEWDCNGYLASLVERLGPEGLSPDERVELLDGLDFLVDEQDADGLWTEGGIIEWEGRLPATTMSNHAGLHAGARIAEAWGEPTRAASYRAAAGYLRGGMLEMLVWDGAYLADEREDGLHYDTSLLFGPAWGFPADPVLDSTWAWIMDNARSHGGGVRYFEGLGYGQDLFGFTTSAAAQYAATIGDSWSSGALLDWMAAFSNRYGLFPERVYADGSGAAEASPLSWCAAETAMGILRLEAVEDMDLLPTVDGILDPAEYRHTGAVALDHDGHADGGDDMVALYALRDGADLYLGLQLAGPPEEAHADTRWIIYLSQEDGPVDEVETPGGLPLTFRAEPSEIPGGVAPAAFFPGACLHAAELGIGPTAMEARLDLTALGLDALPTQIIMVKQGADGREALLPAHGALLTDGDDDAVLVTFELDATAVLDRLTGSTTVTISGDRAELGAWAGHAVELFDDGLGLDAAASDGIYTVTLLTEAGGSLAYKYLLGEPGDPSWDGVELDGDDRTLWVHDMDASGRVRVFDTCAQRGGEIIDP